MKTLNILKNIALAAVMMIANPVSAAYNAHTDKRAHNHTIIVHTNRPAPMPRGHVMRPAPAPVPVRHCCQCRDCNKLRRDLDKHMRRKHHDPRFACHTCNDLHRMLSRHSHMHNYRR